MQSKTRLSPNCGMHNLLCFEIQNGSRLGGEETSQAPALMKGEAKEDDSCERVDPDECQVVG